MNPAVEAFEERVLAATPDVDFRVAYSPVLPLRTGSHPAALVPVNVDRNGDGTYTLRYRTGISGDQETVTAEQLRPMRARYILRHNDYYRRLPTMGRRERDRILETFFEGRAVYLIGALEIEQRMAEASVPRVDAQGVPQPILTVTLGEREDAQAQALETALRALGPAVEMKSSRVLRQEWDRAGRGGLTGFIDDDLPDAPDLDLGKEFIRLLEEARNAPPPPPPPPNAWKHEGGCQVREECLYKLQVWPAGSWGISADGRTIAHGVGGKEAVEARLAELMEEANAEAVHSSRSASAPKRARPPVNRPEEVGAESVPCPDVGATGSQTT